MDMEAINEYDKMFLCNDNDNDCDSELWSEMYDMRKRYMSIIQWFNVMIMRMLMIMIMIMGLECIFGHINDTWTNGVWYIMIMHDNKWLNIKIFTLVYLNSKYRIDEMVKLNLYENNNMMTKIVYKQTRIKPGRLKMTGDY